MRKLWISISALTLATTALPAQPHAAEAASVAESHVVGTMLVVAPEIAYTRATLRVVGPDGYEAETLFEGGDLALDLVSQGGIDGAPKGVPQALPDGRYGYEVVFYPASGPVRIHAGTFSTRNGIPRDVIAQPSLRGTSGGADSAEAAGDGVISGESSTVQDFVWITDGGSDPDDGDGRTHLRLGTDSIDDPNDAGDSWFVSNDQGSLRLIAGLPQLNNEIKYPLTVTTDRRVGVGTTQPGTDLHIFNPGATTRLRLAAGASGQRELVAFSDGGFEIQGAGGGSERAVRIFPNAPDNSLVLHTNGIGIGTDNPGEDLHIRSSSTASVRLQEASSGQTWDLRGTSGSFTVRNITSGQVPLAVLPNAPAVRLTSTGVGIAKSVPAATLHVGGDLRTDGDVALHSSRTVKTGFGQVSAAELLAGVADLPVASWRYKSEDETSRHIGPFAEDFQRLFGLGDGETISVIDAQGVAFAAIQGLRQQLAEKDDEIAQLRERLDARDAEVLNRLERLERRLVAGDDGDAR